MKLALVVPGGVDRSGEFRVIPALLALIGRLARAHEVHVFALHQEAAAARWELAGATVHNIGDGWTRLRAIAAIRAEHRRAPFDLVQAIFSGSCSLVAVAAAKWLRRPSLVHVAGGELVALHAIGYGGRRKWKGRLRGRPALPLQPPEHAEALSVPGTSWSDTRSPRLRRTACRSSECPTTAADGGPRALWPRPASRRERAFRRWCLLSPARRQRRLRPTMMRCRWGSS